MRGDDITERLQEKANERGVNAEMRSHLRNAVNEIFTLRHKLATERRMLSEALNEIEQYERENDRAV